MTPKRTLKSIRIDLGFTQVEMAKFLDMPYATYRSREEGLHPLLARELSAISQASGVPMEDIIIPL